MPPRISHLKDGSLEHLSTDSPIVGYPCLSGQASSCGIIEGPEGRTQKDMQQQALEVGVWQQELS